MSATALAASWIRDTDIRILYKERLELLDGLTIRYLL